MEMTGAHLSIPVTESSQVSAARYAVGKLAASAGFAPAEAHRAGIVATELATNLVKHAGGGGGELLLRAVHGEPLSEIEVLALDRGPGIGDLERSLSDGYSTAGSPGSGMGAVVRLSEAFDIYSQPGNGTAVFVRVRNARGRSVQPESGVDVAGVSVPKYGEQVCGDGWARCLYDGGATLLLVDGVGHGVLASDAAASALEAFRTRPPGDPADGLRRIHDGLRHTRGAVGAIADIQTHPGIVLFAGVGNVSAGISSVSRPRQLVSHNGTLGQLAKYFRTYSYPWDREALLIMHSDGLASHWSLDAYPGLRLRHPSLVAGVLYRDFTRRRDDVTVIVAREQR
jgi:anti-sigma regulatory factor (Ser/Thr protein kinase)